MKRISFILSLLIILLNFSCATTSQNSTNQDLEVKSVQSLTPTNKILDVNSISSEIVSKSEKSTRFVNNNEIFTKIDGEITDEMILRGKDLLLYEKSNTNKCATRNCIDRMMREFVWQHWKNKKQGYIFERWQGIDLSVTTHIFIEPNEQDEWIISWKVATNHAVLDNDITETLGIVSVKQINSKKGGYKLEFKNKGGQTLKTL